MIEEPNEHVSADDQGGPDGKEAMSAMSSCRVRIHVNPTEVGMGRRAVVHVAVTLPGAACMRNGPIPADRPVHHRGDPGFALWAAPGQAGLRCPAPALGFGVNSVTGILAARACVATT